MSDQLDFFSESFFVGQSNPDLEELVLATFVNFPDTYYQVADQLSMYEFSTLATRYIYNVVRELSMESKIDIALVTDKLIQKKYYETLKEQKNGFDLILYLNEICERIETDDHLLDHIKILNGYAKRRALMLLSDKINESCNEMVDPMSIIGAIGEKVIQIQEMGEVEEFDALTELDKTVEYQDNFDSSDFMRSYIQSLDDFIVGFEPNDLIVIAAAPSMGKTALALEILKGQIIHDEPVAAFSLEMSSNALLNRVIASHAYVSLKTIRRKSMGAKEKARRDRAVEDFKEHKSFWIDDKSRTITKIISKIRKYYIRYGVRRFIIDYLQLMICDIPGTNNREQEISKMSRALKEISAELGIIIIALSQINRAIHSRSNKRPTLGDLRESGAIEQDADMVIFVHRPAYFTIEGQMPSIEEAELIIAKGRNVGIGTVNTYFIPELTKFDNSPYGKEELQAYVDRQRDFESYRDPSESNSNSD